MKTLKIAALLSALAIPVAAADVSEMTPQERAKFRDEVRAYLMDNPEVLLEAMQVLRDRESQAEAQADEQLLSRHSAEIFDDGVSYVGGNPDGDVTIVEFLDYRCGYCRKAHTEVAKLLAADGNIRWVVKEFPILGADSDAAAKMAVATLIHYGPDAYATLHDTLMTFKGPVNPATMPKIAQEAGIDFKPLADLIDSPTVADHIARMHRLGQQLNITGTPAFVMNSTVLRGYLPMEDMQKIVAEVRANL